MSQKNKKYETEKEEPVEEPKEEIDLGAQRINEGRKQ